MAPTKKRRELPLGISLALIVAGAMVVLATYLMLLGVPPLSSDPAAVVGFARGGPGDEGKGRDGGRFRNE